jgi:hypothetical protein
MHHPLPTKHPKIIPSLRHGDGCDSPFVDGLYQCWVSIIKTPSILSFYEGGSQKIKELALIYIE